MKVMIPIPALQARFGEPDRAHETDAGYDLRAAYAYTIQPDQRMQVMLDIVAAIPEGVAGLILPRSGLALKHGITLLNAPGLIDPGYRGQWAAIVYNTSHEAYQIFGGERIAQLLLVPFFVARFETVESLPDTTRGENGFGSSGV